MAKRHVLKSVQLLFLFAVACVSKGQQLSETKSTAFAPAKYPVARYKVSQQNYPFGDLSIKIIQIAPRRAPGTEPRFCRAWLEVRKGETTLRQLYYGDIEPVGFSYGVFVPKVQPSADYFIAVKEGDYDGRLLLITRDGTVKDTRGGFYFVTSDERFLVSEYASDASAIVVVDLLHKSIVLDAVDIPYIHNWYQDATGYFFTESEWTGKAGFPHEKPGIGHRLDLDKGHIVKIRVTKAYLKTARRITYDFDPRKLRDCSSQ